MAAVEESGMKNSIIKDVLGRAIVQTVARSKRPHDSARERVKKTVPPEKCFFCPGNEHLTPPELARAERGGKWEVRVFPNKFPAFSKDSKKAYGRHEVIVETPDHGKTLSELSVENLSDYLEILKGRMMDAKKDPSLAYTCIFKNEGKDAGASLEHSHSQLVGMALVPKLVKRMAKRCEAISTIPRKQAKNVFYENRLFWAVCPKGSRFQHEIWIIPKFRANSLDALSQQQISELADALKKSLFALDLLTGFAPYNIVFHSAPHAGGDFPFHVQILPRLSQWAGFELGTDMVMTSAVPSQSAKLLKALIEAG
ncbi:MAG: DUF4921 family protein [Candidatus Micrarchaeota archaeon]|nr:DUF4921 family protein [Candidatus Micrarchaeota archaeon]